MATAKTADSAQDTGTKAPKVSEREDSIKSLISALPATCSHDLDRGAIFGRVMSRLQAWGASDEEIAAHAKHIREATDSYVTERDARIREQSARVIARRQAAIETAIND